MTSNYHRAEWVANTGYGRYIDHQYYSFDWAKNLPITLKDLSCGVNTTTGGHYCSNNKTTTDCVGGYTRTASISCACNDGYYRRDEGCFDCPLNSYNDGTFSRCACDPGYYQYLSYSEDYLCAKCGVDTYSLENSTSCIPCPNGTSTEGRDGANGTYWCVETDPTVCSSGETKVGGICFSNVFLGGIVTSGVAILMAIGAIHKCRRRILLKRQREAAQRQEAQRNLALARQQRANEPQLHMNILVIENKITPKPKSAPKELCHVCTGWENRRHSCRRRRQRCTRSI